MHKIIITEPVGLTDVQLNNLDKMGDVVYYDTPPKDTKDWLARVKDADIIYTGGKGWEKGWKDIENKYVTYIFVTSAFLDMEVLKRNNVIVSNSPGSNKVAVSEWIVTMLLNYMRQFPTYIKTIHIEGPIPPKTKSVHGKSVCIIGKGNIGEQAGRVLSALGMNVDYYTRHDNLTEKIKDADVIVDCLSSNSSTNAFYDADFFDRTKDGVVFVSISRNETQDYDAILAGLESGKIEHFITDNAASAIFDVESKAYVSMLDHPKITVTPHVAAYCDNTLETANEICIQNIKSYLASEPTNLVY